MFLIRTAFWLGLLILLLPTDKQQQQEIYGNAHATVKDLGSFCERNPGVCEASKKAAHTFSEKAQFGARMVMDFIQEKAGDGQTTATTASDRRPSFLQQDSANTLTQDDLRPAWSVPASDTGV